AIFNVTIRSYDTCLASLTNIQLLIYVKMMYIYITQVIDSLCRCVVMACIITPTWTRNPYLFFVDPIHDCLIHFLFNTQVLLPLCRFREKINHNFGSVCLKIIEGHNNCFLMNVWMVFKISFNTMNGCFNLIDR